MSGFHGVVAGLIETWDVLKLKLSKDYCKMNDWLIETWDVLKLGNKRNIIL